MTTLTRASTPDWPDKGNLAMPSRTNPIHKTR
jgi:hypothetical protein